MKKILLENIWLVSLLSAILVVFILTAPGEEKHQLFIERQLEKIEKERQILTEKELKLKELSTQKEWEEVDNDNSK